MAHRLPLKRFGLGSSIHCPRCTRSSGFRVQFSSSACHPQSRHRRRSSPPDTEQIDNQPKQTVRTANEACSAVMRSKVCHDATRHAHFHFLTLHKPTQNSRNVRAKFGVDMDRETNHFFRGEKQHGVPSARQHHVIPLVASGKVRSKYQIRATA